MSATYFLTPDEQALLCLIVGKKLTNNPVIGRMRVVNRNRSSEYAEFQVQEFTDNNIRIEPLVTATRFQITFNSVSKGYTTWKTSQNPQKMMQIDAVSTSSVTGKVDTVGFTALLENAQAKSCAITLKPYDSSSEVTWVIEWP